MRIEDQEQFDSLEVDMSFIDKADESEIESLQEVIRQQIVEISKDSSRDIARFIEENYE